MENIIYYGVSFAVMLLAFVLGRFVFPKIPVETISTLSEWADKFVRYARYFLADKTGAERMEEVVSQLSQIAEKYGIKISETQLTAIAQEAYELMIAEAGKNK